MDYQANRRIGPLNLQPQIIRRGNLGRGDHKHICPGIGVADTSAARQLVAPKGITLSGDRYIQGGGDAGQ